MEQKTEKPPHRYFYVDGKLEFALFYDPTITDPKAIMRAFREWKDWKWYEWYFGVEIAKCKYNKDLTKFLIITKPTKSKNKREESKK